jgi:hypothetical protein
LGSRAGLGWLFLLYLAVNPLTVMKKLLTAPTWVIVMAFIGGYVSDQDAYVGILLGVFFAGGDLWWDLMPEIIDRDEDSRDKADIGKGFPPVGRDERKKLGNRGKQNEKCGQWAIPTAIEQSHGKESEAVA